MGKSSNRFSLYLPHLDLGQLWTALLDKDSAVYLKLTDVDGKGPKVTKETGIN
jgi:hypothetical protein